MSRSFTAAWALSALVLATATVAGCNVPACGPGTKQVQQANGNLQCVPVEQNAGMTPCELFDGGAGTVDIVGGICVSHIKCDPNTTMYDPTTGFCEGTGGGGGCPQKCPATVPAGQVCVTGGVVDFQNSPMHIMAGTGGRALRIGVYDPLAFLNNPGTPPLAEDASTTDACFALTVPVPSSGLVAITVQDPVGATPAMPLALAGAGATVVAGQTYNVDTYMVLQSVLDGWGGNYKTAGTYVGCFFNQPPPAPTAHTFTETMAAMGVRLTTNGSTAAAVPADEKFLKAGGAIDATLTATGPLGCAITAGTGLSTYSGLPMSGGVMKWEQGPGGTAPGVVFVQRFHSCDNAPAGTAGCM
jgi:hypothetical protein